MVTQRVRERTVTTPVTKANRSAKYSWSLVLCAVALSHTISCAEAARSFGMRMDGEKVSNRVSARTLMTTSSTSFPLCDFYLYPGNGTVPSISLDGSSDTAVGPYVMDSVSGQIIEVDSSGKASFICSDMAGTSTGDQFYVNGQLAQMKFRTFNSNPKSYFENSCFVIPLTAVQIPSGNSVINLNLGDSYQQTYPDDRRCLIFATGPSTTSCSCSPSTPAPSPPPPSPSPPCNPPPSPSPPPPSPSPPPPSPPPPSPSPPPPSPSPPPPSPSPPPPSPSPPPPSPSPPPPSPSPPPPSPSPPPPSPSPPPPSPSPPPPSPSPPPPSPPPPPPPSPPPPPPVCDTSCPSSPLELCDFYFSGYKSEIPTIKLVNGEGTILSPGLRTNKTGSEIVVEVDESGSALFRECPSATNSVGNQFYLNGEDAVLLARTFQTTPGIDYFKSRCVQLPISVLRIDYKGVAFNVPADDTENLFTSARRCVMFKTS